jgi:hypothetical protein
MTMIAKLLGRKQQLLERLQENPSPHERDETVRLLMQIETALDWSRRAARTRLRCVKGLTLCELRRKIPTSS